MNQIKPDNPNLPAIQSFHNELIKRGFKYDEFWCKYDKEFTNYNVLSCQVLDAQSKGKVYNERDGVCISVGVYSGSPSKDTLRERMRRNSKIHPDIQASKALQFVDEKTKELEQNIIKAKHKDMTL